MYIFSPLHMLYFVHFWRESKYLYWECWYGFLNDDAGGRGDSPIRIDCLALVDALLGWVDVDDGQTLTCHHAHTLRHLLQGV